MVCTQNMRYLWIFPKTHDQLNKLRICLQIHPFNRKASYLFWLSLHCVRNRWRDGHGIMLTNMYIHTKLFLSIILQNRIPILQGRLSYLFCTWRKFKQRINDIFVFFDRVKMFMLKAYLETSQNILWNSRPGNGYIVYVRQSCYNKKFLSRWFKKNWRFDRTLGRRFVFSAESCLPKDLIYRVNQCKFLKARLAVRFGRISLSVILIDYFFGGELVERYVSECRLSLFCESEHVEYIHVCLKGQFVFLWTPHTVQTLNEVSIMNKKEPVWKEIFS